MELRINRVRINRSRPVIRIVYQIHVVSVLLIMLGDIRRLTLQARRQRNRFQSNFTRTDRVFQQYTKLEFLYSVLLKVENKMDTEIGH